MTWTWLRKGKLKREIESLLITSQNYAIRTIFCKKLKFEHITKSYMHKLESVLENEMLKISIIFYKKDNFPYSGLCRPKVKIKENKYRDKYLELAGEVS